MSGVNAKQSTDSGSEAAVELVSSELSLNVAEIKRRVEQVLNDQLYWLPVRHHSPVVAKFVKSAISKRRPKIIFLEAPSESNYLVPHIVDKATNPPIAIYSSYRDDDNVLKFAGILTAAPHIPYRNASWYPMLPYSPEYVAMQTASQFDIEVRFMDLPHHALVQPLGERRTDEDDDKVSDPSDSEALIAHSRFYLKLAEAAGYRSWDEAWDGLFEFRQFNNDIETFRYELATFCAAVRATSPRTDLDHTGTLARERFMLKTMRESLAELQIKPEEAMVICGGFHLFLDQEDTTPPPTCPPGTVYTTLVPFSYFRVSELSGYQSGNRAPLFYQRVWQHQNSGDIENVLAEHVVAVLNEGRKLGEPLSSADAIAVCQYAELLCRLRGRSMPILDDIHDALITCCCKGDPLEEGRQLLRAMDTADIGTKTGKVTAALGQLPLLNDFYHQLDCLDLAVVASAERATKLDLDKRVDLDGRRSIFLHRLKFLSVTLGTISQNSSESGKIFAERWTLKWTPQIEASLIEQNTYGDTVECAALSKLREQLAQFEMQAGATCRMLVSAIEMDLPNMVHEAEQAVSAAIDSDARFVSQSEALCCLLLIDRYAAYRHMNRGLLDDLIVRCFDRACFSLIDVVAAPDEQQPEIVSSLLALADVMIKGDHHGLDRNLFIQHVRQVAATTEVLFLRGAFLGILTELRQMTAEDLAAELALMARAPLDIMVKAGDFLDGIMAVSRTSILLGAVHLTAAVDELLRTAEWTSFLNMLPRMRGAFERLHERHRDSFAARVAQLYGLSDTTSVRELRTSAGAALHIARIDQEVAVIMKEWDF